MYSLDESCNGTIEINNHSSSAYILRYMSLLWALPMPHTNLMVGLNLNSHYIFINNEYHKISFETS